MSKMKIETAFNKFLSIHFEILFMDEILCLGSYKMSLFDFKILSDKVVQIDRYLVNSIILPLY